MLPGAPTSTHEVVGVTSIAPPRLLIETEPWSRVFFRNVRELIHEQQLPPLEITSAPAPFWNDVFVPHPFPGKNLFRSYFWHAMFVFAVWTFTLAGLFSPAPTLLRDPYKNSEISYYPPETTYLPPVESAAPPAKVAKKGQPRLARQEIISVPAEPDNTTQTIIVPKLARLNHEVPLPNIVANSPVLAQQAIPSSAYRTSSRSIPQLTADVVAPVPEAIPSSRRALTLPADVVAPAPEPLPSSRRVMALARDVAAPPPEALPSSRRAPVLGADVALPAPDPIPSSRRAPVLHASVVAPAPSINEVKRRAASMSIDAIGPLSQPVLLPARTASGDGNGNADAKPAPSAQGIANARGTGQVIALGLDPVETHRPIDVPEGNRSGAFAAGPQGKSDAPGTPDIKAGGSTEKSGSGSTASGRGVFVAQAPPGAKVSPVVGNNSPAPTQAENSQTGSGIPTSASSASDRLTAAARPPDIGRQPAPGAPERKETPLEASVFGAKRSYSLSLNMPNLSSTTGSWVIRFAELKQTHDGAELSAPIATTKVDPAYPPDLLRDSVEGTVVLYAIIRADGTISDIRVLNSVHEKLAANAIKALQRWKFTPGSKHGVAIDLEAVVQIPFRAKRFAF